MSKDYNLIDINTLREFISGEEHDVYLLIRKLYFKDLYMTLYDYCYSKIKSDDPIEVFVKETFYTYKYQNKLNTCLRVTDGKYFDEYLLNCVVSETFKRFKNSKALKAETHESLLEKVVEMERKSLDNEMIGKYNISYLTSLIRSEFSDVSKIDQIINFIYDVNKNTEEQKKKYDFFQYLNKLIKKKNITLNQLGNDSLIKKSIYEISMDKIPTKNQLIMLIFTLKLNKNEYTKLIDLAKEKVKNTSYSNLYSFEKTNERDNLLLHWIENIDSLEKIADKKDKLLVEIVNEILRESNYDILK